MPSPFAGHQPDVPWDDAEVIIVHNYSIEETDSLWSCVNEVADCYPEDESLQKLLKKVSGYVEIAHAEKCRCVYPDKCFCDKEREDVALKENCVCWRREDG